LDAGARLRVFDPEAMGNVREVMGDTVYYATSQYDALEGASAVIVMTEWSEFRNPDFDRIAQLLRQPVIFDGRNVYSLEKMKDHGFHYESIGRKVVESTVREASLS
jgi:UDPglucose 6-dehydrogenase